MRFRLLSPWPVGQWLIPAGTEIEVSRTPADEADLSKFDSLPQSDLIKSAARAAADRATSAYVVPVPTTAWDNAESNSFVGIPLPLPLPLNAKALDQEAYDQMVRWYGDEFLHLLQYEPSIKPKGRTQ
ncbi:hypothetical protein ACFFWD_06545 [Bradyrhizobium erythrophlei]|uniref:hypothetical protein n=1 Tax=Bradyrhizobium erythrophlei TaxID=1437360 RepID=UPI0035ED9333